jgi:hypothetical protein
MKTERKHQNSQSGQLVSEPRHEYVTCVIQAGMLTTQQQQKAVYLNRTKLQKIYYMA